MSDNRELEEAMKKRQLYREFYKKELQNLSMKYLEFLKGLAADGCHEFTKPMNKDGVVTFGYNLEQSDENTSDLFILHMLYAVGIPNGPELDMVIEANEGSFLDEQSKNVNYPEININDITFCGHKVKPKIPANSSLTHDHDNKRASYRGVGILNNDTNNKDPIPMTFNELLTPCQREAIKDHGKKGMMPTPWSSLLKVTNPEEPDKEVLTINEMSKVSIGQSLVFYANSHANDNKNVTFARVQDLKIPTVNFASEEILFDVVQTQENAHKILHNLKFKFDFFNRDDNKPLKPQKDIFVKFTFTNLNPKLSAPETTVPIYSIAYKNEDETVKELEAEEEETSEAIGIWASLIRNAQTTKLDDDGHIKVKPLMTNARIDHVLKYNGFFESLCKQPNPTEIFDFLIGDGGKNFPLMHQIAIFFSNSITYYANQTKQQDGHLSTREIEERSTCYSKYVKQAKKRDQKPLSSVAYELKVVDFFLRVIILAVYGGNVPLNQPDDYTKIAKQFETYNTHEIKKKLDPLMSINELLQIIDMKNKDKVVKNFKNNTYEESAMTDPWMSENIEKIEEKIASSKQPVVEKAPNFKNFKPSTYSAPKVFSGAAAASAGGHTNDDYV